MDQKTQLKIQMAEKKAERHRAEELTQHALAAGHAANAAAIFQEEEVLRLKFEHLENEENISDESPLVAPPPTPPVPEEYPLQDVYVGDDFAKLPRNTPIAEVVQRCISLGSRAFVGPCEDRIGHSQWYIRSPPCLSTLASGRSRYAHNGTMVRGGTYAELHRNMAATKRAATQKCCTYLLNY